MQGGHATPKWATGFPKPKPDGERPLGAWKMSMTKLPSSSIFSPTRSLPVFARR
jgi:hypothetical protein